MLGFLRQPNLRGLLKGIKRSSCHVNIFYLAFWRWRRSAIFAKSLQMKFYRFPDVGLCFLNSSSCRNTPWQIRDIRGIVPLCLLDNYSILHVITSFPNRLFCDAIQRTRCQIVTRLTWYRHTARLTGMFILSMTSFCRDQIPSFFLQFDKHFGYLHFSIFRFSCQIFPISKRWTLYLHI